MPQGCAADLRVVRDAGIHHHGIQQIGVAEEPGQIPFALGKNMDNKRKIMGKKKH